MNTTRLHNTINPIRPEDNPHCVVMGTTGVGKTQFLAGLIKRSRQAGYVVMIDPKSDFCDRINALFIDE